MVSVAVKGHHTVWVKRADWDRAVPARYAVSGESLVVFADHGLERLSTGDRARATVHEIAGGPAISSFAVTVTAIEPDAVDRGALLELLDHVSLGATLASVNSRADAIGRARRLIALAP
jgi:hypothetical protein